LLLYSLGEDRQFAKSKVLILIYLSKSPLYLLSLL
jgi:hypothetical protein